MSIARKDDRHKEEMVDQIASMFDQQRAKPADAEDGAEDTDGTEDTGAKQAPRIRITGDKRMSPRRQG